MKIQPKKQISEYEKQALDFLESTNTSLKIAYSHTDKYFSNDTEKRDIYRFTFENKKSVYSALFGDSIVNTKKNGSAKNRFTQRINPTAYDILTCMDSYMPDTFEDFCAEFGYDDQPLSEHDNVMRVFLNVREQVNGMNKLFNSEQLGQLSEIQ